MVENILDYIIADGYYRLVNEGYMSAHDLDLPTTVTMPRDLFDPKIATAISEDEALRDEIPDTIKISKYKHLTNREERLHTGSPQPSLACGTLNLMWDGNRAQGPSRVRMDRLMKWHHEGAIHRASGHALVCKSVRFEWLRDGVYYRESGPYMITLRDVQMQFHMGQRLQATFSKIDYRWAIDGREMGQDFIERVISQYNFELGLFHPHNVFKDDVQEFEFYTELGAAMDPEGAF